MPFDDLYIDCGNGIYKYYQIKSSLTESIDWNLMLTREGGLLRHAAEVWTRVSQDEGNHEFHILTDRQFSNSRPRPGGPYSKLPSPVEAYRDHFDVKVVPGESHPIHPNWESFRPWVRWEIGYYEQTMLDLCKEWIEALFVGSAGADNVLERMLLEIRKPTYEKLTPASTLFENVGLIPRRSHNQHVFDADDYVSREKHEEQLSALINDNDFKSGYIVVTGPPGIGKSTFLTRMAKVLQPDAVYYCYTNRKGLKPEGWHPRWSGKEFLQDIAEDLEAKTGIPVPKNGDTDALTDAIWNVIASLGKTYKDTRRRSIIMVDGLDHAMRDKPAQSSIPTVLEVLIERFPPGNLPGGVFVLVGTQPLSSGPRFLNEPTVSTRILPLEPFSEDETAEYVTRMPCADDLLKYDPLQRVVFQLQQITGGIPLLLAYVTRWLEVQPAHQRTLYGLKYLPAASEDADVGTYYARLWQEACNTADDSYALHQLGAVIVSLDDRFSIEMLEAILPTRRVSYLFDRYVRHLCVRSSTEEYSLFHGSFRYFLKSEVQEYIASAHQALASYYEAKGLTLQYAEHLFHSGDRQSLEALVNLWSWERLAQHRREMRPGKLIKNDLYYGLIASARLGDVASFARLLLFTVDQAHFTTEFDFSCATRARLEAHLPLDGLPRFLEEVLEQQEDIYMDLIPLLVEHGHRKLAQEIGPLAVPPEYDPLAENSYYREEFLFVEALLWAIDDDSKPEDLRRVFSWWAPDKDEEDDVRVLAMKRAWEWLRDAGFEDLAARLQAASEWQLGESIVVTTVGSVTRRVRVHGTSRYVALWEWSSALLKGFWSWVAGEPIETVAESLPEDIAFDLPTPVFCLVEAIQELRGRADLPPVRLAIGSHLSKDEVDNLEKRAYLAYDLGRLRVGHLPDGLRRVVSYALDEEPHIFAAMDAKVWDRLIAALEGEARADDSVACLLSVLWAYRRSPRKVLQLLDDAVSRPRVHQAESLHNWVVDVITVANRVQPEGVTARLTRLKRLCYGLLEGVADPIPTHRMVVPGRLTDESVAMLEELASAALEEYYEPTFYGDCKLVGQEDLDWHAPETCEALLGFLEMAYTVTGGKLRRT